MATLSQIAVQTDNNPGVGQIFITPGTLSLFPDPTLSNFFIFLSNTMGNFEIVLVTAIFSLEPNPAFTVTRGQFGTLPQIWNVGDGVDIYSNPFVRRILTGEIAGRPGKPVSTTSGILGDD